MWIYRNSEWDFEVNFPEGWHEYGFIRRLFRLYDRTQPEFAGPNGANIKFAIGPISPVPTLGEMQIKLKAIAKRHGHWIIDIRSIMVFGQEHATMVYHMPLETPKLVEDPRYRWQGMVEGRTLRLKNYHIILNQREFVVTGKIALFDGPIGHVGGQPIQDLSKLYAHDEDYDDIVSTFRLTGDRNL